MQSDAQITFWSLFTRTLKLFLNTCVVAVLGLVNTPLTIWSCIVWQTNPFVVCVHLTYQIQFANISANQSVALSRSKWRVVQCSSLFLICYLELNQLYSCGLKSSLSFEPPELSIS